jgi:hypothetical protein
MIIRLFIFNTSTWGLKYINSLYKNRAPLSQMREHFMATAFGANKVPEILRGRLRQNAGRRNIFKVNKSAF